MSEIDLVLVGDDFPVILQSNDGGKSVVNRFKTARAYLEWRQPKVVETSGYNWRNQHGILRAMKVSGTGSRTRVENPPKCSMISPAVFDQLNFEKRKRFQCGLWQRIVFWK